MSRYPRAARAAKVKCIPCNAPAVETADDAYVCVACGRRPLSPGRPDRVVVERDGVRVEKTVRANGDAFDHIEFAIESRYRVPVAVRLRQPLSGTTAPSLEADDGAAPGVWTETAEGLEYRGVVKPDSTVETRFTVRGGEGGSAPFAAEPRIVTASVVDPEPAERLEAPMWRGGSAGSVAAAGGPVVETDDGTVVERPDPSSLDRPTDAGRDLQLDGGGQAVASSRALEPRESYAELPEPALEPEERADPTTYLLPPDSARTPVISVVLPTKDEEEGIGPCIEAVGSALAELELPGEVVVSDSSTDRTPDIARSYGANVVTPERAGYGAAYQYGFEHARGAFIVMGDADTTYDFEELPKLFEPVASGEADIVMGSRFAGEIKPGAMPWLHRRIGNPVLTRFLNTFYAADVTDAHSGFRVIRREALQALELYSDGMEFASEMVMAAGEAGLTIEEVPITYHPRVGEAKLDSLSDGWRHVKFMLTNTPTYVFSVPAMGLAMVGLVTMLLSVLYDQLFGLYLGTHVVIAGSLLTIIGYQVGSLAVFSAVAGTAIQAPRDPVTGWIQEHFKLEHGATLGLALYTVGAVYVAAMIVRWVSSGYAVFPFVEWNMIAFTFIVVGVQTLFYSFFLSLLGQRSRLTVGTP